MAPSGRSPAADSRSVGQVLRGVVNDVPAWLLFVAVVAAIVGLVLFLVWLVRRLVPAVREGFDAEVAAQMLGVVAALFGLLLAFVVVIAYQSYGDAQSNVTDEADALAAIVRDSDAFGQPDGGRARRAVGAYVRAVVDDEWPRTHDGKDSRRAQLAVDGMYRAIQAIDPGSPKEAAFYDDSVRRLNDALEARRNRLQDAVGGLPWVISALLLVGSIVIIGYTVLVGSRSAGSTRSGLERSRSSSVLSLVVLLDLSYPFSGDLAVDPGPFRTGILAQFFAPPG